LRCANHFVVAIPGKCQSAIMKLKNIWFDFTSIFCFLLMLSFAVIVTIDYFRGKGGDLLAIVLLVAIFLLLALTYFRMSLQLGKYQEKARQRKMMNGAEAKEKDMRS
jgi:hypothetical protein